MGETLKVYVYGPTRGMPAIGTTPDGKEFGSWSLDREGGALRICELDSLKWYSGRPTFVWDGCE